MGNSRLRLLLGAGCAWLALAAAAQAGGFSRGSADTDILFDEGNFDMRAGVTYVAPHRELTKSSNPKLVGTNYAEDYAVPSAAIKVNLADNLRCAGTFVQNNGGSIKYDYPTASGKLIEEFTTYESAATCAVGFDVGRGRFWLLGGGFMEQLDYHREDSYASIGLGDGTLNLDGGKYGYRIGAAYEIPEIGLRGQIMYRSGTNYGAEGTASAPAGVLALALRNQKVPDAQNPFLGLPANMQVPIDALGTGRLPQSVDVKFQTGIAPGWLAFGGVKWTDWSVMSRLDVRSVKGGYTILTNPYYWKDGWTVTAGLGHAFTDRVSGLVSLTWDSGVSTGYDLMSDSYTLAFGGSMKDKLGGELRAGVGLTYLTSATETKNFGQAGDDRNQAVKAGYAVGFNVGYKMNW
jgi:long-chain fatty acid transport protein